MRRIFVEVGTWSPFAVDRRVAAGRSCTVVPTARRRCRRQCLADVHRLPACHRLAGQRPSLLPERSAESGPWQLAQRPCPARRRAHCRLAEKASRDDMTGMLNRESFFAGSTVRAASTIAARCSSSMPTTSRRSTTRSAILTGDDALLEIASRDHARHPHRRRRRPHRRRGIRRAARRRQRQEEAARRRTHPPRGGADPLPAASMTAIAPDGQHRRRLAARRAQTHHRPDARSRPPALRGQEQRPQPRHLRI